MSAGEFESKLASASAPVTQTAASAPTAQHEVENLSRLVQSMRVQVNQGVSEATVRLRPEHLGEVNISIKVDGNVVTASIHAESASVRQWLEANESSIRSGLADQGLHLDRFVVERERLEERSQQRQQEQPKQPPRQWRFRRPQQEGEDAVRFEVSA
jgi:flagellar hook-length control protein FliK